MGGSFDLSCMPCCEAIDCDWECEECEGDVRAESYNVRLANLGVGCEELEKTYRIDYNWDEFYCQDMIGVNGNGWSGTLTIVFRWDTDHYEVAIILHLWKGPEGDPTEQCSILWEQEYGKEKCPCCKYKDTQIPFVRTYYDDCCNDIDPEAYVTAVNI